MLGFLWAQRRETEGKEAGGEERNNPVSCGRKSWTSHSAVTFFNKRFGGTSAGQSLDHRFEAFL